ncbi:pilus assembly protein [Rhodopseudomonas sp. WA056]|uniref:TadE/TadG family type IV pilus assembly protein n=1 Tax=Rhodopseudomonas sp. WA056 TaxID=2269367 RepID=UPI0013DFFA95|nr:TadE/TadG family type IV pilus assembly protein [Rhodopseudomonas sp. WA056]NEW89025.1 pilus assembly protein [Rhodopseudomonas sp. WA056]
MAFAEAIARFHRDRRGNIAVIFALVLIPLISAIGCAVDYSRANALRTKLQAAADAASVGAVSRTSPAYIAAGSMSTDGAITSGADDALRIFNGNLANLTGYTLDSVAATVSKSGEAVTSKVTFSAQISTMFMKAVAVSSMTVGGASTATASMPKYIDFYLLLDNSPSMGVGATPTDVAAMVAATANKSSDDHCAFACHDVNNKNNYYNLAKALGITTRIDVLRSATQQLMDTAAATATYTNQFRMAIYDFGASAQTAGLRNLFALSASLSSAKTAAGAIDLMTVKGQNDNNDQDTQYTAILPAIDKLIAAPGTGAAGSPLKYLFFVSDGVADEYNPACLKPKTGNRCQSPINPALCKTLKDRGVRVAVLYTTYLDLPSNDWYKKWIAPFNEGPYGPSPNSEIAKNMEACASPGFYFEVSPTQGIAEAMNALFKRAVADARITS